MAVDVSGISGDVFGIVGMGIGLGVLAGTAGMVMRSMDQNLYRGRRDYRQKRTRKTQNDFYNPYLQPKFDIGRRY